MAIITPESKIEVLGLSEHAATCLRQAGSSLSATSCKRRALNCGLHAIRRPWTKSRMSSRGRVYASARVSETDGLGIRIGSRKLYDAGVTLTICSLVDLPSGVRCAPARRDRDGFNSER